MPGLLDKDWLEQFLQSMKRSKAPEMAMPIFTPPEVGVVPPNLPPPKVGDPMAMFESDGGGRQPILDRIKSKLAQSGGGYDPMTGIDWNTGRGGGDWRKTMGK